MLAPGSRIAKGDSHRQLPLLPEIVRLVIALARQYRMRGRRLVREALGDWRSCASPAGCIKGALLTPLSRWQARKAATAGPPESSSPGEDTTQTESPPGRVLEHLWPALIPLAKQAP